MSFMAVWTELEGIKLAETSKKKNTGWSHIWDIEKKKTKGKVKINKPITELKAYSRGGRTKPGEE